MSKTKQQMQRSDRPTRGVGGLLRARQIAELPGSISIDMARRMGWQPGTRKTASRRAAQTKTLCCIDGDTPQQRLWRAIVKRWPGQARWEYKGVIPGRRYSIDIAFPAPLQVALECDGWAFHGRHLSDFHRDRVKRNLMVAAGWAVLAFSARQISQDIDTVLSQIQAVLDTRLLTKPKDSP